MGTRRRSSDDLANWFAHHPPKNQEIIDAHERIRRAFHEAAEMLNDLLPEGDDKEAALQSVRRAMYDANSCIAVAQAVHRPV
jgi:hypothetical protein